eukprot:6875762-Pyramimonas_sp.AAC.1
MKLSFSILSYELRRDTCDDSITQCETLMPSPSTLRVVPPVFGLVGLPFGVSWIDLHHVCLSCAQ